MYYIRLNKYILCKNVVLQKTTLMTGGSVPVLDYMDHAMLLLLCMSGSMWQVLCGQEEH